MNEEICKILAQYGLSVRGMRLVRSVVMAQTDAGFLSVKRSRLRAEEIAFSHAAQEHIFKQGFNQALRFRLNNQGIPYSQLDGHLYVVSDWVPSEELKYDRLDDLVQAAKFLAEFHLSGRGFTPPLGSLRVEWGVWPAKFSRRLHDLVRCQEYLQQRGVLTQFDRIYLSHVDGYREWAEKTLLLLNGDEYCRAVERDQRDQCFCHHDYSDRNILRTPGRRLHLVDFDYCLCDVRMHDLASLVIRALKGGDWGMKLALAILHAYQEVCPLAPFEPKLLLAMFQWPEGFWRIGSQYYDERLPWPQQRFVDTLSRRVRYKRRTERFLRQFAAHYGISS